MNRFHVLLATSLLILALTPASAYAFTVSADQDVDSGGAIAGGGDSVTPSGADPSWTYEWGDTAGDDTDVPVTTPGLSLGAYKLYADDNDAAQGTLTLDLNGGDISGTGTLAIRTFIGNGAAKDADHVVIQNVGSLAMGGIDAHANNGSNWSGTVSQPGNITIGASGTPAGDVRVDYLYAQSGSDDGTVGKGRGHNVTIYGSGNVLIENGDGSVKGNIRTHTYTYDGGNVNIVHDGAFRADQILTWAYSGWSGGQVAAALLLGVCVAGLFSAALDCWMRLLGDRARQ